MPDVHIIGYGSVAQALEVRLRIADKDGSLMPIAKVSFFAPEIKEECRIDGVFSYHNAPMVERETLAKVLDMIKLAPGDIVLDLATRIDTIEIWHEVKRRLCHFLNSAFDVWGDMELDLNLLDNIRKDPLYSAGSGLTAVFGMGMNPGIVNHFVAHGLKLATGLADVGAAAEEFGLSSIIFSERDNQWPRAGSASEKLVLETQEEVLYCTWSPGNYLVETKESKLLYPGLPKEAGELLSVDPTLVSWVPSGPIVGFSPPHDETFTVQRWFRREIPALFIYESPPPARFFLKGSSTAHSSEVDCKLFSPKGFELRADCCDTIGVILLSNKPDREPFWCGLTMSVDDAFQMDSSGVNGPTPMQVMGGVWTALQFIIQHPQAGECFPEEIPTDFVIEKAFPWSGQLLARPCPEALRVPGFFDPAAPDALERIRAGAVDATRIEIRSSSIHGNGSFATKTMLPGTVIVQLPLAGPVVRSAGFCLNHSCCPNSYVDRNRAVRTLKAVAVDEEITIDYALTAEQGCKVSTSAAAIATCSCGSTRCRKSVGGWVALDADEINHYLNTVPILREVEEDVHLLRRSSALKHG